MLQKLYFISVYIEKIIVKNFRHLYNSDFVNKIKKNFLLSCDITVKQSIFLFLEFYNVFCKLPASF